MCQENQIKLRALKPSSLDFIHDLDEQSSMKSHKVLNITLCTSGCSASEMLHWCPSVMLAEAVICSAQCEFQILTDKHTAFQSGLHLSPLKISLISSQGACNALCFL